TAATATTRLRGILTLTVPAATAATAASATTPTVGVAAAITRATLVALVTLAALIAQRLLLALRLAIAVVAPIPLISRPSGCRRHRYKPNPQCHEWQSVPHSSLPGGPGNRARETNLHHAARNLNTGWGRHSPPVHLSAEIAIAGLSARRPQFETQMQGLARD